MIQFFRKIRYNLIEQNKTGKYLKYAIGEIILVVIGILIALQINDWNAQKSRLKEEHRILQNIQQDVITDTLDLTRKIERAQHRIIQMDSVYFALKETDRFTSNEFIQYAYSMAGGDTFNVNSGTYDESLSASTLKYIRNDEVRQEVFEYYRNAKQNQIDQFATLQKYDFVFPVMFNKLSTSKDFFETFLNKPTNLESINIKSLSEDKQFISAVNQRYASEITQISNWKNFIASGRNLLEKIHFELNSQ